MIPSVQGVIERARQGSLPAADVAGQQDDILALCGEAKERKGLGMLGLWYRNRGSGFLENGLP
jgi:hypothetical protein